MGKIIKSSFKKIITKFFQVLGISSILTSFGSCIEIAYGSPDSPVMYGVPGNFFTLEGTITDEDGNAIKGIELSAKAKADVPGYVDANGEHKEFYVHSRKELTGEDGFFSLYWNDYDDNNLDFTIYIKDIDGEENGLFNDITEDVSFDKNNFTDKSNFGNEKYKITGKTIKLTKKTDSENTETDTE